MDFMKEGLKEKLAQEYGVDVRELCKKSAEQSRENFLRYLLMCALTATLITAEQSETLSRINEKCIETRSNLLAGNRDDHVEGSEHLSDKCTEAGRALSKKLMKDFEEKEEHFFGGQKIERGIKKGMAHAVASGIAGAEHCEGFADFLAFLMLPSLSADSVLFRIYAQKVDHNWPEIRKKDNGQNMFGELMRKDCDFLGDAWGYEGIAMFSVHFKYGYSNFSNSVNRYRIEGKDAACVAELYDDVKKKVAEDPSYRAFFEGELDERHKNKYEIGELSSWSDRQARTVSDSFLTEAQEKFRHLKSEGEGKLRDLAYKTAYNADFRSPNEEERANNAQKWANRISEETRLDFVSR
jgi:hypothetical protein